MANVVLLDQLLSGLLSAKGKDIMTAYNDLTTTNYPLTTFAACFTALETSASDNALDVSEPRLLFCEADGTVIYDSSKRATGTNEEKNTLQNYKDKKINENHNSRIAIIKSLLSASGRGYEVKRSTSTGANETYVAIRLGTSSETSIGTMRISYQI